MGAEAEIRCLLPALSSVRRPAAPGADAARDALNLVLLAFVLTVVHDDDATMLSYAPLLLVSPHLLVIASASLLFQGICALPLVKSRSTRLTSPLTLAY